MKIYIITLPFHANYGGILQNYALQFVLRNEGHEVYTINKSAHLKIEWHKKIFVYSYRLIRNLITSKKCSVFFEKEYNKKLDCDTRMIRSFVEKHINAIHVYKHAQISYDCDCIIVGSDQVWRAAYFKPIEDAFLSFVKNRNIKRISYAASFGGPTIDYKKSEIKRCKKLIKLFDSVSVREQEGVTICKNIFGIDANCVLDPTMLLTRDKYEKLIPQNNNIQNYGYILVYILDMNDEKKMCINRFADEKHLQVKDICGTYSNSNKVSIEEWLQGFLNAAYVITDSFHAGVFSIIMNTKFIIFNNENRGNSRFETLLNLFHLDDRLICENYEINEIIDKDINWNNVNPILESERRNLLDYLLHSINM